MVPRSTIRSFLLDAPPTKPNSDYTMTEYLFYGEIE
jgi:hypothetical protein